MIQRNIPYTIKKPTRQLITSAASRANTLLLANAKNINAPAI